MSGVPGERRGFSSRAGATAARPVGTPWNAEVRALVGARILLAGELRAVGIDPLLAQEGVEPGGDPKMVGIETGIDISVHPYPTEQFDEIARMRTGFYENVERDGILVE